MTGGMVIVSYTLLSATAGSILMIQGINQSMWANHEESQTWRKAITRKSNTHSTTYGLCYNCYTSGPNNMGCLDGCRTGEYKTVQYGDYTFDCQTIAEKLGKHHTTAMSRR
jgi:hypothetical protein